MTHIFRQALIVVGFIGALATSAFAAGVDVNATATGLALRGFDPVSYFTEAQPIAGDYRITAEHDGATYRFASEANRDAFMADPARYAPQYGGYCAFGAAMGFKFDGDPNVYQVVDDKLYLNLSEDVAERWREDIPGFITLAEDKWPAIQDKAPAELQN